MELYWSSNTGVSRQRVPDNVFSSNYTGAVSAFSGLNYSYVEGAYKALPDYFTQNKVKTGNVANIDLGMRNKNTQFAVLWEGFINIPADGTYTFETKSDDGSKVYIGLYNNGISPLVNNDGEHAAQTRKGTIYLSAGVYPIAVSYYQITGDQLMELYWSSNTGIARQLVPDNAFKSGSAQLAGGGSGNISYKYFEGNFSSVPDLTSLTPVKTGNSSTFNLDVRNRNTQYAMMWQTNITIPVSGSYTFETSSDDGSKLYLGSFSNTATPLIDNDGQHTVQSISATQYLNAGSYAMTVLYAQIDGAQNMDVYWSSAGTGLARQKVPDNAFTPYTGTNLVFKTPDPVESGGLTGKNNYYFSSTTGDDARSAKEAQNPATPWKSIDKLNSIMPALADGDAVLLKRGDVFDGAISLKRTSNQTSAIIVSSYGTGNKPVINGFATMYNWSNLGNGIWASHYNYSGTRINMVTINGKPFAMGRYPNANDPVKGYLTYDSHTYDINTNTGSITDNEFNSSVNWTGGELALRKRRWVIDQCPITYQSGNTFYYKSPSYHQGLDGFGYFIQNHPKTLDQFGEWYFDPASKYLQVYFGADNPNNFEVKESVVDVLLTIQGQSNITIDNLTLQGASGKAISVASSNNIKIANCNVSATGVNGIDANYANNLNILNCSVRDTHNAGIFLGPSVNNSLVRGNNVVNTAVFAGMGSNSDNTRQGITVVGDNDVVEYNEVDSTGYNAIKFKGNSITVRNNLVNTFCFVVDDGGGIYTYDGGYYGRKIQNNVIVNGLGASDGTDSYYDYSANGIDLDDRSNDVEMSGNSISHCNGRGIGNHNSHELVIAGNTIFDCDMGQVEFAHDLLAPQDPIRNVNMIDNIFVSKRADQPVMIFRTKDNDIAQMGGLDNNYFCRPINDNQIFSTYTYFNTPSVIPKWYDLPHWKRGFGYDEHSGRSPVSIAPYTISSTSGNMVTNGNFDHNIRNIQTPTGFHTTVQYDGSGPDGGSLKVSYTGGDKNNSYQSVQYYEPSTPSLQGGHTYRVRFSAWSAADNNTDFFGSILPAFGGGSKTDAKLFKITNTRSEVELLFTPASTITSPYFEIYSPISTDCPVFWLDNLAIQEVYSITPTNPDDYMRFEYNATTSSKTIPLDGVYVDMKNNSYNNSITLSPYTSAVLVRANSPLVQAASSSNGASAAVSSTAVLEGTTADNAAVSDLSIMPNPAVSKIQLTLKAPQGATGKATLIFYAASGAVVNTREISASAQSLTIDVSSLARGVYTVNVIYGKRTISKRFVKL